MFYWRLAAILRLISWVVNSRAVTSTSCWSCTDPEPYLLVGLRNVILRTNLEGGDQKRLTSDVGHAVLMDFNYREGKVYWVDTHTGILSRVNLDGTHTQKLLSLGNGISGLAVDWRENSVYLSSRSTGTIWRAGTDGDNLETVLRGLTEPSSLVIDPNAGYVFWVSAGKMSSIQRSGLTGALITTVLKIPGRVLCLAVDVVERKLFWIQYSENELSALGSCDYNGSTVNVISQRLRTKIDVTPKMSLFSDYVYVTDSATQSVMRINRHTGQPPENVSSEMFPSVPVAVKVIHPSNQPAVEIQAAFSPDECVNVCSSSRGHCKCKRGFTLSRYGNYCEDINECALWNHGCSLGCENVPGTYFCTCPKGYVLLPDHRTCREMKPCVENGTLCEHACTHTLEGDVCVCPVGSSLKLDRRSCTGCLSVDRGGCSQVCVTLSPGRWECECQPGYQLQPDGQQCKAPGFPPLLLFANMVDVRSASVDGPESRSLINESKLSNIMAVDYDPVQNRVYFADIERGQIASVSLDGGETEVLITDLVSPEGLAVDWINRNLYWTDRGLSSVSRCRLSSQDITVLIHDRLLQPRDMAVHPQAQMIFWTDLGFPVSVWRAGLDGEERTVLIGSGLVSPCGITVDQNTHTLYWSDIGAGRIEAAGLDGSHRHTLTHEQAGRPFDVAVFEDTLWFSNWEDNHIYSLDKRTGSDAVRLSVDSVRPASLAVVHPLIKHTGADLGLHGNGSCDGEWTDQLKNKFLNDEGSPPHTEKMLSDQGECFSLSCDVSAQCVLEDGVSVCRCLSGFTGDGQLCLDVDECHLQLHSCDVNAVCVNTLGGYYCRCGVGYTGTGFSCSAVRAGALSRPSSASPLDVTTPWQRLDMVETCPSTHDSYCLNGAACFYFPEMETYACNCAPGYIGERCQYTNLEWWDLQQAELEKRRNTTIAVCITLLLLLLSITGSITIYYCRRRRCSGGRAAVNMVSETGVCEESGTEAPPINQQFYIVLEHEVCNDEKILREEECVPAASQREL
ncbi:pro-epidermal growth factor [Clarias gariepinus]|uniref:pro-epidermal growth factor n=1 Tax=Clarias gariepinus TaxID=13013 RepID=UPI00234D592B|nr:pro-epidermal growth factor [Clarias gariepinus]